MITKNPLFISSQGGSITCFKGDSGRIFRSCSRSRCIYSGDLHSAKAYLEDLERKNNLLTATKEQIPAQRKTTLKWSSDGELSAVDMARILDRLATPELTKCDLVSQDL
ncbi:hypothetical protein [Prochlorococcus sp. MIT 1307]|uniref:hypothetical protein n=1 Tax=Prochlorococcus sp. MIT 1307 TaxID=3096219 RepID=UPI002A75E5AD|nr:hypothetical protein [Prochlorococcus sp. MIT 1307]